MPHPYTLLPFSFLPLPYTHFRPALQITWHHSQPISSQPDSQPGAAVPRYPMGPLPRSPHSVSLHITPRHCLHFSPHHKFLFTLFFLNMEEGKCIHSQPIGFQFTVCCSICDYVTRQFKVVSVSVPCYFSVLMFPVFQYVSVLCTLSV